MAVNKIKKKQQCIGERVNCYFLLRKAPLCFIIDLISTVYYRVTTSH